MTDRVQGSDAVVSGNLDQLQPDESIGPQRQVDGAPDLQADASALWVQSGRHGVHVDVEPLDVTVRQRVVDVDP